MFWRKDQLRADGASQRRSWQGRGFTLTLLCALALGLLPGVLLTEQHVHAAANTAFTASATTTTLSSTPTDTPTDMPTTAPTVAPTTAPTIAPTTSATVAPTTTVVPTATTTDTPTPAPTATATPAPLPTQSGSGPYSLDYGKVSAAAQAARWPQKSNTWCGIATVALIADFIHPNSPVIQDDVVNAMNSPAGQSDWGVPQIDYSVAWGPGVNADISRDFGTDPRSLAEGLTLVTGYRYHVIVDTGDARDATYHIVRALMASGQPISVFVDHGQHSIIVSGVDATGDPLPDLSNVTGIHVWDPGGAMALEGIQDAQYVDVPKDLWLSGVIWWSGSDYLKYPYSANNDNGHELDPDPAVGPYTYIPGNFNHLWVGHYVFISPLAPQAAWGLNADWELNQYGAVLTGYASSNYPAAPVGYTGPTAPMPTNPPPPPPPVQVFKSAPLPPKPAPKPKPTPTPLPTVKPTPTLRPRPSPTPDKVALAPAPTPTAAVKSSCVPGACGWGSMAPGWALLLLGLLLTGALGVTATLIRPDVSRQLWLVAESGLVATLMRPDAPRRLWLTARNSLAAAMAWLKTIPWLERLAGLAFAVAPAARQLTASVAALAPTIVPVLTPQASPESAVAQGGDVEAMHGEQHAPDAPLAGDVDVHPSTLDE